ncbi:MAG TPA: hypothetical protein V6D28_00250 [Leptolyngbyaceae cyanobacterium]
MAQTKVIRVCVEFARAIACKPFGNISGENSQVTPLIVTLFALLILSVTVFPDPSFNDFWFVTIFIPN